MRKTADRLLGARASGAVALLLGLVLAVGCSAAEDAAGPAPVSPTDAASPPAVSIVAEGLDAPWSVAFHDEVAFVSERDSGRILEIGEDGSVSEAGVVSDVEPRGEGGLLGIAVHRDHLYAYLTTAQENRIDRYRLDGSASAFRLGESETIFAGIAAGTNHNGGRIAFGPDGMLYVTAGDAGDRDAAQDLNSLSGKILRLTPEGEIPDDNPFAGSAVYSYGHRNPQGLGWDDSGALYASEFGQDTWDELNRIEPGGNYGWPDVEGAEGSSGLIDPIQQWSPADASPSGIAIVDDRLFIANLRGERLREVALADPSTSTEWYVGEFGRLRDVVLAPDGSLWLLTNNTDGRGEPSDGDDRIIRVPLAVR